MATVTSGQSDRRARTVEQGHGQQGARLQGHHGGRAGAAVDDRELAERVGSPQRGEHQRVEATDPDLQLEAARRHDVQAVARVTLGEHDRAGAV